MIHFSTLVQTSSDIDRETMIHEVRIMQRRQDLCVKYSVRYLKRWTNTDESFHVCDSSGSKNCYNFLHFIFSYETGNLLILYIDPIHIRIQHFITFFSNVYFFIHKTDVNFCKTNNLRWQRPFSYIWCECDNCQ